MPTIGPLGMQVASNAIDTVFGLALEHHNDKRQLEQQQKLQDQQIRGQQTMANYNYYLQKKMWEETNYSAQMEQLRKAGLNPGLIYGMGGGGGATTGSQGGNVTGAQAPSGGGEIMGLTERALQQQLIGAQIENIKADTNKKNTEAGYTGGAQTDLAKTQIASLNQGINNQKAQETLTRIQSQIAQQDWNFNAATIDDRIKIIAETERKLEGEASQALIQANVDSQTRQTKIETIRVEYIQKLLENSLIAAMTENRRANTLEIKQHIGLMQSQMYQIASEIDQKWNSLDNEGRKLYLEKLKTDFDTDVSNKIIQSLLTGLGIIAGAEGIKGATTPVRNPVGFKY